MAILQERPEAPRPSMLLGALAAALAPIGYGALSYWSTRDAIGAVIDPLALLVAPVASGVVLALLLKRTLRPAWRLWCAAGAVVLHLSLVFWLPAAGTSRGGVPWLSLFVLVPSLVWIAALAAAVMSTRRRPGTTSA